MTTVTCPLCAGSNTALYHQDNQRSYNQCATCHLVFVPPAYYLSASAEKAHYDLHQNNPDDDGYRKFLSRVFGPIVARVPAAASGLDFGSGPGPTLSVMFAEAGYPMAIYDPFYATDPTVLNQRYDFITCTEVVEHLHHPATIFKQLVGLLRPGGWLGIMTKLVIDSDAFSRWHYKNDPTHVCFYSRETFNYLAATLALEVCFIGDDVILLHPSI